MTKVVTVEIVTNCAADIAAENAVLDALERERAATDAESLTTWQVTGIADHFSDAAKAYSP